MERCVLWGLIDNFLMIAVGFFLIYLAIAKNFEPLLLLPIGFGAILANIPNAGLSEPGGILHVLRVYGIENELFPALLFIGIGAMSDFSFLIKEPFFMIFAIAGQMGIFITLNIALALGFNPLEASSISIIGAMDGPTAIFVTQRFASHLLGPVTVCAYSYMALVPLLQIPLSKLLISKRERLTRMDTNLTTPSRTVKILFPIIVFIVSSILTPQGALLMGSLMFGNLMRESGVVSRLSETAEKELTNVVTLLLGLSIGGTMRAEAFINQTTLFIFGLGLISFVAAITLGLIFAKVLGSFSSRKINPLIGACGISAFPMAARTAHLIGRQENSDNWILPHALAANVGGQIASVAVGGAILTYAPILLQMLR